MFYKYIKKNVSVHEAKKRTVIFGRIYTDSRRSGSNYVHSK